MEATLQFLQENLPILFAHRYWFLFLGSMIEGLNTMVLGGFLVSAGSVKLWPTFSIFVAGYIVNGYIWYAVGYFAGAKSLDKWGRSKEKSRKIIEKVEEYFHRYSGRAIVITKFTFSFTIATLIMAGSLKYNLRKFTLYNIIGSVGWVALTMFVGYFFGQSYRLFIDYLRNFTYFLVFLAGAIALIYIFKNLARSAFVRSLIFNEKMKEISEKFKDSFDKFLINGSDSDEEKK